MKEKKERKNIVERLKKDELKDIMPLEGFPDYLEDEDLDKVIKKRKKKK